MNNQEQQINITPLGDTINIRHGQAIPIYQYDGFQYTANSTDSLITLVKSKGVQENCVIAYDEKGFKAILNDKIMDRDQDRITYNFKNSLQYKEWERILTNGVTFDQKNFIDFLRRREVGEIVDPESLIAAIQNFKYVTNIAGDFTYDNNNNYTFAIKVGDAEGTVHLPQMIYANIEVYNESGFVQCMEIELEVRRPKGDGEKPSFALTCPKLPRYLKSAVEYEIEKVKIELKDYLIVAGNI
ncbi:DUF2303 family protein [Sporomusa malonica]|uniref:Uncharacterized conserved protein n=1 Tax=Sporomusa malonica TaxID=112901 RepID=A0A1W2ATT0_9FIRM|nr:DUF2303 family protein [Sporomusa malonica]SMC64123.1 Uncharacterized conserved protein [Sporomusa malonica]